MKAMSACDQMVNGTGKNVCECENVQIICLEKDVDD